MLKNTNTFYAFNQHKVIEDTLIIDEYSDKWGPIWRKMSEEFNAFLLKSKNLHHLKSKTQITFGKVIMGVKLRWEQQKNIMH
jgi:hypothetical protein